jgi:hypothetical protein
MLSKFHFSFKRYPVIVYVASELQAAELVLVPETISFLAQIIKSIVQRIEGICELIHPCQDKQFVCTVHTGFTKSRDSVHCPNRMTALHQSSLTAVKLLSA